MKFILLLAALSTGCAYSIRDIETSNKDSGCVRECSTSYSSCVSSGNQIGFKTETLRACRDSYAVCISSCPRLEGL
jgi:hypothetical protein